MKLNKKLLCEQLTIALLAITTTSCILADDSENSSHKELASTKEAVIEKEKEYEEILSEDHNCSTPECIETKKEYEAVLDKLEESVQNASYKHRWENTTVNQMEKITDNSFTSRYEDNYCYDGKLKSNDWDNEVEYEIIDGFLEIKDYCTIEVYKGSSDKLQGTWTLDHYKVNPDNTYDYCKKDFEEDEQDRKRNTMRVSETLVISDEKLERKTSVEYNCLFEDAMKEFLFRTLTESEIENAQYDCNSVEIRSGDLTLTQSYSLSSEAFETEREFKYKNQSCKTKETYSYYEELTDSQCATEFEAKQQFDDCMKDLLEDFCKEDTSASSFCGENSYSSLGKLNFRGK